MRSTKYVQSVQKRCNSRGPNFKGMYRSPVAQPKNQSQMSHRQLSPHPEQQLLATQEPISVQNLRAATKTPFPFSLKHITSMPSFSITFRASSTLVQCVRY